MNETLTRFERIAPAGSDLPVLITPASSGQLLTDAAEALRHRIDEALLLTGGVLLRDFTVPEIEDFRRFAASFGHPLLKYEFASTPRSAASAAGIYTSTEYPAHQHIPLHNEQAYTREWPMKIWFHCATASPVGGETPIADSRAIHRRMPERIRALFEPGLLYVRNYGEFDVPWQKVFNTDSRAEVEAFCRRASIRWEWKPDGDLRTTQLCQGIETHPVTGEKLWFNQAHLFHVSAIEPSVRASLLAAVGEENLPRHVYFGDGSAIADDMLDTVREVYRETAISFPWQPGDILMLDNRLVAHGRNPFTGDRKVIVAMA